MRKRLLPLVATGLLALSVVAQAAKLKVGDKAPAVQVAKWVKGTPVSKFAPGKVYVVEFWATWCGPCRQTIPHLTEMAKKYKGKVTFAGISVWETRPGGTDTAYYGTVTKFVKDMGAKMDYNVGVDGPQGSMAKGWMEAAGQEGIPAAFVIDQQGMVAWIGHPMDGLDEVVDKVVTGKFDKKEAARVAAERQAAAEKARAQREKMQKLFAKVGELVAAKKYKEAVEELDRVIAANPDYKGPILPQRFLLLHKADPKAAYAYARELAGGEAKDAQMLNAIAWSIVDERAGLESPDYDTAVVVAERAAELSKNEDPSILDTLAYAQWKKGDKAKALETMEKAIKILDSKPGEFPEEAIKEVRDRYAMMKKG